MKSSDFGVLQPLIGWLPGLVLGNSCCWVLPPSSAPLWSAGVEGRPFPGPSEFHDFPVPTAHL